MSKQKRTSERWYKMDLHLHTPGSADYQQSDVTYLDILQYAESKGLDIVAFTDHNTVRGYAGMLDELERLRFLEALGRVNEEEQYQLAEYERLMKKLLILPGFEFTATFGFHILCIFSEHTTLRQLEHILMQLNVPRDAIEQGLPHVGASADVLTCYEVVSAAGGMVIAAHANSTNGIVNRNITFDETLRIAYSQDPRLDALEVTDLEKPFRTATVNLFDGTKRGYPRRMHCIQGSDAHRITAADPKSRQLGVGDRCTEILLETPSFASICAVFRGDDFSKTRPHRLASKNIDHIKTIRQEGPGSTQSFYRDASRRGGNLAEIVQDVCGFANTEGGIIYIGLPDTPRERIKGVKDAAADIEALYNEIEKNISPTINVQIETQLVYNQNVILVRVPNGNDIPYVVDNWRIYVRDKKVSRLATRDEIVQLVGRNNKVQPTPLVFGEMAGII